MKRLFRDLGLILALAALWGISGYVIGLAIETTLISYSPLKIILTTINVILGLLLLRGIIRDPTADRIFFEGPRSDEAGLPQVGCLWALPASLLLLGLLIWVAGLVMRFILK